jgi:hypothetical protein
MSDQDRQIEKIQSKKLVLAAKSFLQTHRHAMLRTPTIDGGIKEFLLTIDHTLSLQHLTDIDELKLLRKDLLRLLSIPNQVVDVQAHHLTTLETVTVERIYREKEMKKTDYKRKQINDSVSAAKIQSLLQDQKVSLTETLSLPYSHEY